MSHWFSGFHSSIQWFSTGDLIGSDSAQIIYTHDHVYMTSETCFFYLPPWKMQQRSCERLYNVIHTLYIIYMQHLTKTETMRQHFPSTAEIDQGLILVHPVFRCRDRPLKSLQRKSRGYRHSKSCIGTIMSFHISHRFIVSWLWPVVLF